MSENKSHRLLALITGATKGIGRAIAEKLASREYDLLLTARSREMLESLREQLQHANPGVRVEVLEADLSHEEGIRAVCDWATGHGPSVLINNVGTFQPVSLLDEQDGVFLHQFQLNYYAAHMLCIHLGRQMRSKGQGHIFNISSTASRVPVKAGAYTVTKFAMRGLTYVLREELRDAGVKVTEIIPGSTRTASWDGTDIPDDRFVKPGQVAEALVLCLEIGEQAGIEELVIKPQAGNIVTDC